MLIKNMFFSPFSVVYEHHSKLEKSLQKERFEHKKAEEGNVLFISTLIDFLIYTSHLICMRFDNDDDR